MGSPKAAPQPRNSSPSASPCGRKTALSSLASSSTPPASRCGRNTTLSSLALSSTPPASPRSWNTTSSSLASSSTPPPASPRSQNTALSSLASSSTPLASPRSRDTALSSLTSSSTPPVSDAGRQSWSSYAQLTPPETRVSNAETQWKIDHLTNRMIVLYCSIHDNEDGFVENIDKLIKVLFCLKKLKLQELGLDASETDVVANTVAATVSQEILDLVPEVMQARLPEKLKSPVSKEVRTAPVTPANGEKHKLKGKAIDVSETHFVSNTAVGTVLQEATTASIPEKLKCPISKELMTEPVILASGQTCNRQHIEEYLKKGIWICPMTDIVLENDQLTPNLFARDVISEWCKENGVAFPETKKDDEEKVNPKDYYTLAVQLERMNRSLTDRVEAAKIIRKLTKEKGYVRRFFVMYPETIPRLLEPLKDGNAIGIFNLQEDLIATVFHILAQDEGYKEDFPDSSKVIPLIVESMRVGTISTKCHAAAALLLLSAFINNKPIIGDAGAIRHLVELLEEGHPSAMRVASEAIFSLCLDDENVERAINAGVVKVILKKINAHIFLDSFIEILGLLSYNQNALAQIRDGGAESLLKNIRDEEVSEKTRTWCSYILQEIRSYSHIQQANRDEKDSAEASRIWSQLRWNSGNWVRKSPVSLSPK